MRSCAGRRLGSPALVADGAHARADAYVSLPVVASAAVVALGLPGASRDGFMGFRSAGSGRYVASGHPDPRETALPANLGLVESRDGGASWRGVAYYGTAASTSSRRATTASTPTTDEGAY